MPRFHVVGAGAIGCLVSAILAENGHRVTLIVRQAEQCQLFHGIKYRKSSTAAPKLIQTGLDVEIANSSSSIDNLIVATKAQHSAAALASLKHRWLPSTTAIFLENGMSWQDSLTKSGLSLDNIILGVNKHGVERCGPFDIVHHNWEGGMDLAAALSAPVKTTDILTELSKIRNLNINVLRWADLLDQKVNKLVVNACINPLTAILNVQNGQLLQREDTVALMRSICDEAAQVFEGKDSDYFFKQVEQVCHQTHLNTSSMLQDIKHGRTTEISAINEWLCKTALCQQNLRLPVNETLIRLVKSKTTNSN
ncbi:hypothetical protein INT43_002417 [Umbelopsis isabellina]|uniref:2-dehydropantoate 2-reductase n=1 Tax=Mortierella isabellina TaxID=91625 RepID=A0A8H7UP70_MORIS|nr:hypothetical protein INT43_002417 [Umbelopsis isabellina]